MKIGVFVPIGNNGWLISTTAPQYMPTFELNKAIVQKAEHYHFDFALSMIKLRGFGGKTEFWDHNLESFTLMAGLAAVTSRIQIYATAATLTLPPAIVARMASTIDSISGGRFGVNLVTGWQKPEYEQMGLWPGDDYFSRRYDYLTEYVQVLRLLESFELADLHAAVKQAIQLGAIGFDAVKHLILCRVERRPPRLDLAIYPYLPRATVEKTSVKAYMRLLSSDAGEAA